MIYAFGGGQSSFIKQVIFSDGITPDEPQVTLLKIIKVVIATEFIEFSQPKPCITRSSLKHSYDLFPGDVPVRDVLIPIFPRNGTGLLFRHDNRHIETLP